MADIKITDLVDKKVFEELERLNVKISDVERVYVDVARKLAGGLNIKVDVSGDLDKVNTIIQSQMKRSADATSVLNGALHEQAEIARSLASRLNEVSKTSNLSVKDSKELAKASKANAEAMEKMAKASQSVVRAEQSASKQTKSAVTTEEQRVKIIKTGVAALQTEVHSIKDAQEANRKLRDAVKNLKDTDADYAATLKRMNDAIAVNTAYIKKNSDTFTQQKMTVGDYKNQIVAAMNEIGRGSNVVRNFGVIATSTGNALKGGLGGGLNAVKGGFKSFFSAFIGAQLVLTILNGIASTMKNAISTIADFEFANSKLQAILGETSQGIKDLEENAKMLGSTTRYTASEVTGLQIELAKLGFAKENITQMTKGVLEFAMAVDTDLSSAASLAGAALRMFGARADETDRYVSAMAVATTKSALSFSYLQTALPIVGAVAHQFNFSIEDTLAIVAKLADAGIDASMAATATRNIILKLADANSKLAKTLGQPIKSLDDLGGALNQLKEKGIDLGTEFELVGPRCVTALALLTENNDKLVDLRNSITGVEDELHTMSNTMQDNVTGSVASLSSAWEGLILVFSSSKGVIKDVIDSLAQAIRDLSDFLSSAEQLESKYRNLSKNAYTASGVYGKNEEEGKQRIKKLTDKYVKEGMKESDAFVKAQQEVVDYYKKKQDEWKKQAEKDLSKYNGYESPLAFINSALTGGRTVRKANEKAYGETMGVSDMFGSVVSSLTDFSLEAQKITKNTVTVVGGAAEKAAKKAEKAAQAAAKKRKTEAEKERKEQLKIEKDYQDSVLALTEDGLQNELMSIKNNYVQKIAQIKGDSEKEKQTRINLGLAMQKALDDKLENWTVQKEISDINNKLEVIEKGGNQELVLRSELLNLRERLEIREAEKNGADVVAIEQKYNKKRLLLVSEFNSKRDSIAFSNIQTNLYVNYNQELKMLEDMYDKEIAATREGSIKRLEVENEYARKRRKLEEKYANDTAESTIKYLTSQLNSESLSAEDRLKINQQLQKALSDLDKQKREQERKDKEEQIKDAKEIKEAKISNAKEVLQYTQNALSSVADLSSNLFDRRIDEYDKLIEKTQDNYDKEVASIERLEESGAISSEEAEARKRAAEAKTAAASEKLTKEQNKIKYRQALVDKANSMVQAAISTALAILQVYASTGNGNFISRTVMAGIMAGIGAVQLAAIASQPINAYKKGTDNHPGGMAIVGDGGKSETVLFPDGKVWYTPNTPTLVDMPKGTVVLPDTKSIDWGKINNNPLVQRNGNTTVGDIIVSTDNANMERGIGEGNKLLKALLKQNERISRENRYAAYISSRI